MDNLLYWKTVACIVKLLKEGGEGEKVNGIKEILNFLYSHFSLWLRRLIPHPRLRCSACYTSVSLDG